MHIFSINYAKYRNLLNDLKVAKQSYYSQLLKDYKNDIRKTWGVINALVGKTNDKSSISDIFKINNTDTTDPKVISEGFCEFFYQCWY